MTRETASETRKRYQAYLGNDFGEVFHLALDELVDLNRTWGQFKNLFCRGRERVDLLNKAGASFYYNVDRHFFSSVMLAICRLSDPPKSVGKKNLTVHLFLDFMDTKDRADTMTDMLQGVSDATKFARDWRNRRFSHNSFDLQTGDARPLEIATVELVDNAIASLYKTMQFVTLDFMSTNLSGHVLDSLNNEMVMLNRLFLGVEQHNQKLKRLKNGEYDPFEFPKWLQNT
jgi:hypothetical protein